MNTKRPCPHTTGTSSFDPDALFGAWQDGRKFLPVNNDLRSAILTTFSLLQNDSYIYHAIASVTLAQVQQAIEYGGKNGLHAWYIDEDGKPLPPPPTADIVAYTSIFASKTSTSKLLTSLASNAKKGSLRASIAEHLQSQRLLPSKYVITKSKTHINPYYDYWCWSCQNLEWAGPERATVKVKTSHHILPIFMHHFGCVVPSYEGLEIIKQTTHGRRIVEIGSGNGYWAYMLRRHGVSVVAVDNIQSEYRTLWIGDTIINDGKKYLKDEKGAKDAVLLLVYPIVASDFTPKILEAYSGDTICVAGTQNRNGYTAFKDRMIDEHMAMGKVGFRKTVQVPLPSFAGKDEALFVFERQSTIEK